MKPAPGMADYAAWYQRHRARLTDRGQALDGGEPGRAGGMSFEAARFRLLICRLSSYADVRESITHRMLFHAARQVPDVYVDLAFLPERRDAERMRRDGVPWWLGSASKRAPRAFDALAISISVQQEALNLPAALRHSGLEMACGPRLADARHPFILLGGNASGGVPFLHGATAPGRTDGGLVDVVCFGDGLLWLQELLRRAIAARETGEPKLAWLERLAREVPGTYVPAFYAHGPRGIARLRADVPLPVAFRSEPETAWTEGYDGAFIPFAEEDAEETLPFALGCAYRCRFCQTGWLRGAFQCATPTEFCRAAGRLKAAQAASELNLLSSDACSVPHCLDVLEQLRSRFRHVSIKSLALASLARDPAWLDVLAGLGKREFSFGIEGISRRLRQRLGKEADERALVSVARRLAEQGLRRIKLFFIATGWEEDADWNEWQAALAAWRSAAPKCTWIVSFTPLFHAPFTPLQFAEIVELEPERAAVAEAYGRRASGYEFRWSALPGEVRLMNLLCRAGRAATPLLVRLSIEEEMLYRGGLKPAESRRALALLAEAGLSAVELSAGRLETDWLPWDDLACGTPRHVLWQAYAQAAGDVPRIAAPRPTQMRSARVALPPSPAIMDRLGFWVQLTAADAWRPSIAVARGRLRELFLQDAAWAEAYQGRPELIRPDEAYGLALLMADFSTPHPAVAGAPDFVVGPLARPPAARELRFVVRHDGSAVSWLEQLRARRIPYQTVRAEPMKWSVVGRRHRAACGMLAIGEMAGDGFLVVGALAGTPGGRCQAFLIMSEKCPRCGALRLEVLMAEPDFQPLPCLDCLLSSG